MHAMCASVRPRNLFLMHQNGLVDKMMQGNQNKTGSFRTNTKVANGYGLALCKISCFELNII